MAGGERGAHARGIAFVRVESRGCLHVRVWERGAGSTAGSGSSACAAVAAMHRLGLVDRDVRVVMPGGSLAIALSEAGGITLRGPVAKVAEGTLARELVDPRDEPSPPPRFGL